jgi:hypothetical protein
MAGEVAQRPSPTSLQPPNGGNSASSQRRSSGHRLRDEVRAPARCAGIKSFTWTGPGPKPMPTPPPTPLPTPIPTRPAVTNLCTVARGPPRRGTREQRRRPVRNRPPAVSPHAWVGNSQRMQATTLASYLQTSGRTPGQTGRLCVNVSSRRTEASDRQLHFIVPCPGRTINGVA